MARLGKALYEKKGKAKQIQPPHDNTNAGVNKPMEGETIMFRIEACGSFNLVFILVLFRIET